MRPLKAWPGSWIATAWVAWLALLLVAALAFLAVILRQDMPGHGNWLPTQFTDVQIQMHPRGVVALLVTAFGPPLVLTAVWLGQGHRGRRPPPA